MGFEQREGSGSLFKNTKREKDSQPNARGECMIGGVIYEVSAWTKLDKNGQPWQSLAFKAKGDRQEPAPKQTPKPTGKVGDMDDDLPFAPFDWF